MEETKPATSTTPHLPLVNSNSSDNSKSNQQQLKKLYFKPSATEALHSAILLKARTPATVSAPSANPSTLLANKPPQTVNNVLSNNQNTSSIDSASAATTISNASAYKASPQQPKQANLSSLLSISSMSSLNAAITETQTNSENQLPKVATLTTDNQVDMATSTLSHANSSSNPDEFDSPLKIKENLLASIKNMPMLDALRSSSSDDEDIHSENMERKVKQQQQSSSTEIEDHNNNSEVILLGSNTTTKTFVQSVQAPPQQQRNVYFRTNSLNFKTVPHPPKFINNINLTPSVTSNSSNGANSTVILTRTPNGSIFSNNLISTHLMSRMGGSKRGKEEAALSNSSSSDEESEHQHQRPRQNASSTTTTTILLANNSNTATLNNANSTNNTTTTNGGSFKLQQLILSNGPSSTSTNQSLTIPCIQAANSKPLITPVSSSNGKFSNQLVIHLNSGGSGQQQPQITPVVNSAAVAAAAAVAAVTASSNQATQPNQNVPMMQLASPNLSSVMDSETNMSMNSPTSAHNINSSSSQSLSCSSSISSSSSSSASPSSVSSASPSNASSLSINSSSHKSSLDHDFSSKKAP
jgi:hypothetical protein